MFGLTGTVKIAAGFALGLLLSAAFFVLFYEGLHLPIVGQVIKGNVQLRIDGATENTVATFERDALAAQLAAEQRRRELAEASSAKAQERADASAFTKAAAEAELTKRIAADTAADGAVWREEDIRWGRH